MATQDYRGYTFPGYNMPIAAPRGDKHKKMVLVRKGARVKLVRYGLRGMRDYTQHGDRDRRKSYLARSAGIRDKRGRLTKNDIFSANYWARRDLWAANPHHRDVMGNSIMATKQIDYSYSTNDYRRKSIAELDYIIRDASEAAQAMRGMNSAAESKYLEQVADAETERARRRTKRNPRKQSYAAEFDSMMGRESFEGMMKPRETCNLCGGAAGSPGMKAYDARGRMIQGCVGEIHGEALTPATEYARWWSRPEAKKLRAAMRKGQSGKGYGDNATRKNPRRSATVHASDKYLLQIKHGAKWKTLHSASSPELLKEDAQVLRKAGLRSAMQVIKK